MLIPALAWFVFSLFRRKGAKVSSIRRMKASGRTWRVVLWWLPEFFTFIFFAVTVVLLAGPQRMVDPGAENLEGLSITLALDRSGSMGAIIPYGGKNITRLDGVKQVTRDFFLQRPDDQFALVSFARYPETNTPLTGSKSVLLDFLDLLQVPENQDEDGTAIGDALVLAAAHQNPEGEKKSGIIILLTDGQNNRGDRTPEQGADIAKAVGATVYTIGLGGEGILMQDTPFGQQAVGMPVAIDEATLTSIAAKTGGKYFRAEGIGDLAGFYREIAERETVKLERTKAPKTELALELGLWALFTLTFIVVLCRYSLLRRRDA